MENKIYVYTRKDGSRVERKEPINEKELIELQLRYSHWYKISNEEVQNDQ